MPVNVLKIQVAISAIIATGVWTNTRLQWLKYCDEKNRIKEIQKDLSLENEK